jgi:p-hydroxybenzoate 3-monooxygenase
VKTQVAIIGAGPSGLLLSQLLSINGIDSVVLERQSREHVMCRIRAGVLEQGTADLLEQAKVGARMKLERLVHDGFTLGFSGQGVRVDLKALTGKSVTIYGQTEVTRDLVETRIASGGKLMFEATEVAIEGFDREHPMVRFKHDGQAVRGIDPLTGHYYDDTRRYVDATPKLSVESRRDVYERNARRVYPRIDEAQLARGK